MKTKSQTMPRFVLVLFAIALFAGGRAASAASATPPDLMSYQGYLVDVNGAPLASTAPANYPIEFRIYDASTGGNILWAEQQIVTVDKGNFSVVLGEGTAVSGEARPALSSAFAGTDSSDRYLGITVTISGTTMTISPRLRLLPAPYAFAATTASTLVNSSGASLINTLGGDVGIGTPTPTTRLTVVGPGAVTPSLTANSGTFTLNNGGDLQLQMGQVNSGGAGVFLQSKRASNDGTAWGLYLNPLGGNVGIGTTSPDHKLTVASTDNVAAFVSSGGNAYIRVWDNTGFDNRVEFASRGNGRAAIWSGGDHLSVLRNGNVGIGTTVPATRLHVNGLMRLEGQNTLEFGGGMTKEINNGKIGYQTFSSGLDIVGAGGDAANRRITLHSQAGIQVYGAFNINGSLGRSGHFAYLNGNGHVGTFNGAAAYSILADQRIGCPEFNAFSDERIKNIVGLSDSRRDLEIIQKLRVTEYRMVDKVAEPDVLKKGFIAQEVESVIPEAVTVSSQFIPDIYSTPSSFKFNEQNHTLNVTLPKPHGLKAGDHVKIITDDVTLESEVTDVRSTSEFIVGKVQKAPKQAFVYGRKVSDFRSINYDRIFSTGIGAIQELARQVEALKQSEARVAELEKKAAKVDALEEQVAKLQKLVADLASATRNSANTVANIAPVDGLVSAKAE